MEGCTRDYNGLLSIVDFGYMQSDYSVAVYIEGLNTTYTISDFDWVPLSTVVGVLLQRESHGINLFTIENSSLKMYGQAIAISQFQTHPTTIYHDSKLFIFWLSEWGFVPEYIL